ncbi:MAG: outer membrane lipoprotein LolB [Gammaproteobacteria bacterium]|nr:MAG: outer membrane lipoprotein LolB [Gammaproteobacteria bacterium]
MTRFTARRGEGFAAGLSSPSPRKGPLRACLLLLLTLLGGGCAELRPYLLPVEEAQTGAWQRHREQVAALQEWTLTGRIGIKAGAEAFSATIDWQQRGEAYRLRIIAPLGQGSYQIEGDPGRVVLTNERNERFEARDPEALMEQNLGWSVPLSGLAWWVRGLPAPGESPRQLRFDEEGRLTDMEQQGWRISVLGYRKSGVLDLPARLYLFNDRFQIRMVITRWET